MRKYKNLWGIAAVVMLICSGLFAASAQAAYIVTLEQVGSDVVATGSGTLDLTNQDGLGPSGGFAEIVPNGGLITTGPAVNTAADIYLLYNPTGPRSLGNVGATSANSGSGDLVGIGSEFNYILTVPQGYVSDSSLLDSSTYADQTFSSLGVTPGTYEWTWGSGADADSFTLNIEAATASVPEPNTLTLLGTAALFGLLMAIRRCYAPPGAIV